MNKTPLLTLALAACSIGGTAQSESPSGVAEPPTEADDTPALVLFDFTPGADLGDWEIENDVVMGGRSTSEVRINEAGHAVFTGAVSLENNGGFASLQHAFDPIDVTPYRTACIRLKGDGKRYQLFIESNRKDRHYYVSSFQTGTDWQTVEIPLAGMTPSYRGDALDLPNYPGKTLAQVRLFISNQKAEAFHLEIDRIWLK